MRLFSLFAQSRLSSLANDRKQAVCMWTGTRREKKSERECKQRRRSGGGDSRYLARVSASTINNYCAHLAASGADKSRCYVEFIITTREAPSM